LLGRSHTYSDFQYLCVVYQQHLRFDWYSFPAFMWYLVSIEISVWLLSGQDRFSPTPWRYYLEYYWYHFFLHQLECQISSACCLLDLEEFLLYQVSWNFLGLICPTHLYLQLRLLYLSPLSRTYPLRVHLEYRYLVQMLYLYDWLQYLAMDWCKHKDIHCSRHL